MDNKLKSKTRLAFIQYIFLSLSSNDDLSIIKSDFNDYFHNLTVSSMDDKFDSKIQFNKNMFNQLIENYNQFIKNNDPNLLINPLIDFERKFNKWSKINQSILLSIICELRNVSKEKIKIILNDYLNISKSFITKKELKMLNAIIDKYLNEKKYI